MRRTSFTTAASLADSSNRSSGNSGAKKSASSSPASSWSASTRTSQGPKKESPSISVDKRGLYEEVARLSKRKKEKSPMTPLGELLKSAIKKVGPISLADFMDVCLSHAEHGYYMKKESAKIGKAGDFVTAPEISQMFGELLGIWMIATWEKLGMPKDFRMVEIGPGKGTLMKDVLRVSQQFTPFMEAMGGVHMVETSHALRQEQAKALGAKQEEEKHGGEEEGEGGIEEAGLRRGEGWPNRKARWRLPDMMMGREKRVKVLGVDWHDDVRQVPVSGPLLVLAQELLDALPVHQFEYTEEGWRERLVEIDDDPETPHHFKVSLAKGVTRAVLAMENTVKLPEKPEVGMGIEVCPLALQIAQQVAERVARTGGAALFIDYGEDYVQADSLRGLKRHAHVDALSEPGEVDLSTDVDFAAMKDAVEGMDGVKAFGPVPQGAFLSAMGIETRLGMLLDSDKISEKQALTLYDSYRRLVDPDQMGKKYKVLAFVSTKQQGPSVGFPADGGIEEEEGEEEEAIEEEIKYKKTP